jgi:hypothetical protein
MKKLVASTILLMLVITMLISCSKDDPTVVKENPLATYLTASGFSETTSDIDDDYYEFGISFIPQVAGKITAIVVKLPDNQSNLRVTIWDVATQKILRTETIASAIVDIEVTQNITPLSLVKNKEYMITFNTNDWYNHEKPDQGETTYPILAGEISVTGYAYNDGTTQTFPMSFQTDYYAGDLSFVFQHNK